MRFLSAMGRFWFWFWKTFTRACEIKEAKDRRMCDPDIYFFDYHSPYEPRTLGYSLVLAFFDAMNEQDEVDRST